MQVFTSEQAGPVPPEIQASLKRHELLINLARMLEGDKPDKVLAAFLSCYGTTAINHPGLVAASADNAEVLVRHLRQIDQKLKQGSNTKEAVKAAVPSPASPTTPEEARRRAMPLAQQLADVVMADQEHHSVQLTAALTVFATLATRHPCCTEDSVQNLRNLADGLESGQLASDLAAAEPTRH